MAEVTLEKSPINATFDYVKFAKYNFNREIMPGKVANLIKMIKIIDLTRYLPILVDADFRIIDGQHRFEACKRMEKPIYYIVVDINSEDVKISMRIINTGQSRWTQSEWVHYHSELGNEACIAIKKCMREYKMNVTNSMAFICRNSRGRALKEGTLKIENENWRESISIAESYYSAFPFLKKSFGTRSLVDLICSPSYDHAKMWGKIYKNRYDIDECATNSQYNKMWEEVLNKNIRLDDNKFKVGS